MKCPTCGRRITPRSNFCPYCGKPAAPRRSKPEAQTTQSRLPLYVALVVGGIAIGVLTFYWFQKQETATTTATAASTNFDPTLRGEQLAKQYPAVYEVASQFNCPCGTCDDGIEVCDCEMERGAAEVRMYIYQLLQIHETPHAIKLVEEKYGHRKSGASEAPKFEKLPPLPLQNLPKSN